LNQTIEIVFVVGARPNFMKVAPILAALQKHNAAGLRPRFEMKLIHTGQHYDRAMSDLFFEQLGLPPPEVNLGVGSGSHAEQTAAVMIGCERFLSQRRIDLVVVAGDVNSTLAAALAARKLGIPVAHVEAGLRSHDSSMPEEINRRATDAISDLLFASEASGVDNLRREGVEERRIALVGNTMIDSLTTHIDAARRSDIDRRHGIAGDFALITLHRPSNVDSDTDLARITSVLMGAAKRLPLVFPCHPRTRARLAEIATSEFSEGFGYGRILLMPPLGYFEFLKLMDMARIVLTDSGGVQEETTALGVPCLTLRDNTERPATVSHGSNRVVGREPKLILSALDESLTELRRVHRRPELWDGRAAERIVQCLLRFAATQSRRL